MNTARHLSDLYPEIEPYRTGILDVDDFHRLYWEESGNPDGTPALFLHGGPGSGATPLHRRFFDPDHYRIIILDQRGSGRSVPLGCLDKNTTPHLISDLEALRNHLGVEKWLVFGGSWGSSLALAYAYAHAERCLALVLRGIFLCRDHEIEWFMKGMGTIFPEAWRAFAEFLPTNERRDILSAYYERLIDPDPEVYMPAAQAWCRYEASCSTLRLSPEIGSVFENPNRALGLARIEAHYFRNHLFLAKDELLQKFGILQNIPGAIVQGRYDIVCPIQSADILSRAWPRAEYTVVPDAGHSAMEPGIMRALVKATNDFRSIKNDDYA